MSCNSFLMKTPQVQEIGSTPVPGFLEKVIPAALKAVIFAVTTVAAAVFGYVLAGVAGLAIGALAGAGLGLKAISVINDCFPAPIDPQDLTDLTDPKAAQSLVEFYQALPEGFISDGPTNNDAREIQAWMIKSPRIRKDCAYLNLPNLRELPKEIGLFDHLIGLRLTRSDHPSIPKIQTLPATIGNLQFLSSLELANNQLRDLPVAIGKLKNLTWLDLYNNQIQEFPNMIGDLTSLENIDLSMNQLQTIREELGEEFNCFSSRNFKTLNLSGNPIAEFPDTIGNLRHKREGVYVAKHRFHEPLGI